MVASKGLSIYKNTWSKYVTVTMLFQSNTEEEAQLTHRDRASTLTAKILYMQNAAQMAEELHPKSPATGERPSRPFKVTPIGAT